MKLVQQLQKFAQLLDQQRARLEEQAAKAPRADFRAPAQEAYRSIAEAQQKIRDALPRATQLEEQVADLKQQLAAADQKRKDAGVPEPGSKSIFPPSPPEQPLPLTEDHIHQVIGQLLQNVGIPAARPDTRRADPGDVADMPE